MQFEARTVKAIHAAVLWRIYGVIIVVDKQSEEQENVVLVLQPNYSSMIKLVRRSIGLRLGLPSGTASSAKYRVTLATSHLETDVPLSSL